MTRSKSTSHRTSFSVEVNVDAWDIWDQITDDQLLAEIKARGLLEQADRAVIAPHEYPPSTAASITTMEELRKKFPLRGARQ